MFAPAPPLADTPTRAIERGLSSDSTDDAGGDGRISLSGVAPATAGAHNHKPLVYGSPISRGRQPRGSCGRQPRETASIHDPEARQREAFRRMVLVDHLDRLPHVVDILRQTVADQRRRHERALVE